MRPVILEMTAFGSYAQWTSIDFRVFDHNLYLITGDTGAGKTTIFDGIMMALYGEASGEGDNRSRTFEMMHCDHVDRSVDTVVKLTFEHMGKTHVVERTLHYLKTRGTGEYTKAQQKAQLWEEDKAPIKNPKAVTGRMEELLGMDAKQFRKIVMLAQGEFKKFLDADSDEKNKILGELFDNSVYVYYQELFDRARNKLERRRREEGSDKIVRAMEGFLWPQEISEEDREIYTPGHSGLEEALRQLTRQDEEAVKGLEEKIKERQGRENGLREQLGSARAQNAKLEELAGKEKFLEELWERKPEMERLEEETRRADRAFYRVRPKEALFSQAKKVYEDTRANVEQCLESLEGQKEEKSRREESLEQCRSDYQPVIKDLEIRIANIERAIPNYEALGQKARELKAEQEKARETKRVWEKAREDKSRTEQEIRAVEEAIESLDGIEAETVSLKAVLDRAQADLNKLTGENGLKARIQEIHTRERELKKEREGLQILTREAEALEEVHHQVYQEFISGQAGLLARSLKQELQEKKEASCPVCGTVFHSQEGCAFAEMREGMPEQRDVDKAKVRFEKKDREREEQAGKAARLESGLQAMKESVLNSVRELMPECKDWETLDGSGYLGGIISQYEGQRQKAKEDYGQALKGREQLSRLKKQRAKEAENIKRYEELIKSCDEARQEHGLKSSALKAAMEELKKTLDHPDRETAECQKRAWEEKRDALGANIRKAELAYEKAKKDCQVTEGALRSSRGKLPGYEQEMNQAEELLRAELARQGFESLEEVKAALEPTGTEDGDTEQWILDRRQEAARYKNDLENVGSRVRELKEETKGLVKTDMGRMEDEIRELETEREGLLRELDRRRTLYDNHRKTAGLVGEANGMLKRTESAFLRLDSLADLAAGTRNTAGGKLSFDRYVMGYLFREVLEMANQRLDIMSGGRYELVHEIAVRRDNAKAGLEIAVLDMVTGKRRPASSLSGGESFFVSLSLALGLSDVVQNHAGGTQLDALFIDEGFGSLDGDVLERALSVLNQLTEGRRLVGIISHVERLEESIPQQIRVRCGENGSWIQ